ncbi:MAG: membrane integrity-associated transporter subunit PqiC [Parvularculaceae bacterium]|nr:membrane integrity-associated transporter subunit PqiC [Parvularculaceae bacterium]
MRRFAWAAALSLSACVSVLPDAPPASARYQVTDVTVDAPARAPAAWTLAIEDPEATLAFNTAKIALSRGPARIEYYAGGEWVDRAPRLLGAALVRSFENTGAIRGVGTRVTLPVSTFALQTDIRKLTITHQNGAMTADVAIFARLTNGRSVVHASKLFTASEPIAADNAGAAAIALNAGLEKVQRALVAWTIEAADAAAARPEG